MTDEKLCDERHDRINGSLERIELKLDRIVWKLLGFVLTLIALIFAGMRIVG